MRDVRYEGCGGMQNAKGGRHKNKRVMLNIEVLPSLSCITPVTLTLSWAKPIITVHMLCMTKSAVRCRKT